MDAFEKMKKKFLDLIGKPTIFFGVTIAGPAVLLGLDRFCPYGS